MPAKLRTVCALVAAAALFASACGQAETAEAEGATPAAASAPSTSAKQAASPAAQKAPAAVRFTGAAAESALRAELKNWKATPYLDNGSTRRGIDNDGFTRAIVKNALGADLPSGRDDQYKVGKQVDREGLAPGDLAFFESGFGPFKSKYVGVYVGKSEVAMALKDAGGVTLISLADPKWGPMFKTGRHLPTDPKGNVAPVFNAADYGSNRAALLRDIAKAWKGTLYQENGKTFDGIGNDEFVREVYGAINETDLPGTSRTWSTMGKSVAKESLQPGDVVIYTPPGAGRIFNQRAAGLYIGDGEFVHALKGSAVTITKIADEKFKENLVGFRRIDPDSLAHTEAAAPGARPATAAPNYKLTDQEQHLRDAVEAWRGTPYKIGGTSKKGIDCSAFTREMYSEVFKKELPRTAEEQETLGAKVDRTRLQTGDLVFFRTQGMGPFFKSRHVGVYLGGGEFAQASGKLGVTITRLDNAYWAKKFEGARRLEIK